MIDLKPLWNFADPAASEAAFRAALAGADADSAFVLRTQIARSHGLRRDFERARAELRAIEPGREATGAEGRVRWYLEWGRSLASATHDAQALTEADKEAARRAWTLARDTAQAACLDALAIDAIHMFGFVDTAPADQLRHAEQALAIALASSQPAARDWEASLRNNIGMALHGLGRLDEALAMFRQALAAREKQGRPGGVRIAHWMIAWTLRGLKRDDEALAIQLRLEQENEAAGSPDRHVFEELETLFRNRGDTARAEAYAARKRAAGG